MASVRRGKVDIVVCFKLDRLGRSLSHLAQIIDEFSTHKVALVVPAQGIDTSEGNPAGGAHILCAVAEFEREIIRERVNAGLAVARKKDVRLGRPATLDAHRGDIARLRAQGLTFRAIAKELRYPGWQRLSGHPRVQARRLKRLKTFGVLGGKAPRFPSVVVIYARLPSDNSLWEYAVRRGSEDVQVVSHADVLMRAVRAGKVEILSCSTVKGLSRSSSHHAEVLRDLVTRRVVLIIPA